MAGCPAAFPAPFTSAVRYDVDRRVTGTIAPDPDGDGPLHYAAVRNRYDPAGRLTRVETGELAAWQPDSVAPENWPGFTIFQTVDTAYDALDRKVAETLSGPAGPEGYSQTRYDLAGRVLCVAVRMNKAAFPAPGAAPPQPDACLLGAEGDQGPDRITRNDYDSAGQLTAVWKAWGTPLQQRYAAYEYQNLNGKQTAVTDANGNRAELGYDGFDRQSRWTFPSAATAGQVNAADYEAYGYDANGNRTSLRKRDGSTLTFQYDALNRMTVKVVPERPGLLAADQTRDVYYAYDNRNLQTGAWFGSVGGEGIATAYDSAGRPILSTTTMGGVTRTLQNSWNEEGGRTSLSLIAGGGYFAGYGYDGLGRMIRVTEPGDYPVTTFAYRPDGRRGTMAQGPGVATSSSSWDYDEAGRLKALTHDLAGTASDQALTFTYNPAAQMVSRTSDNPLYKWTAPYPVERNYAVNGLNQYQSTTGTRAATFDYDANGNLTRAASVDPDDGTTSFVYDVENRLVSASGKKNALLSYDPLGRLWKVQGSTGARTFLHDGDAIIAEFDASGAMTDAYVHGNGDDDPLIWHHLADGPSLARKFLKANHQGSIIAIAGNDGAATAINSYDPWGVPGPANQGLFQYTGQVWLPELGMYYYKARIYWAALGRFLQTDPVGYADQINLYAYVGNDPLDRNDPTGLKGHLYWTSPTTVTYTVKYYVKGVGGAQPGFTEAGVKAQIAKDFSGTVVYKGKLITITAQAIEVARPGKGVNTIEVHPTLTGITRTGRPDTNAIGGDLTRVSTATTSIGVSHEVGGHGGGAGDQYKDGVDASGHVLTADVPGRPNRMHDNGPGGANAQSLQEIISARTNTNRCAKNVDAPNGGC